MPLATLDRIVDAHVDEDLPLLEEHEWETENAFVVTAKESSRGNPVFGRIGQPHYWPVNEYIIAETVVTQSALEVKPVGFEVEPLRPIQAELIACLASRPHESIKLLSKLGAATFLFTILVYYIGGALIVNPVVAFFGILACFVFWIMAKGDEYLHHR